MTLSQDILAELAEIAPVPRSIRRAPSAMPPPVTPGSYEVLFRQQDADFPLDERFAVAAKVAKLHRTRWRRTMPVSASPIRPPIVWSRRWPLPACSPSPR